METVIRCRFLKDFCGARGPSAVIMSAKFGPLDSATEDPIGGESLLVGNIEYTIPLIDFLKLASFFDVGNVGPK